MRRLHKLIYLCQRSWAGLLRAIRHLTRPVTSFYLAKKLLREMIWLQKIRATNNKLLIYGDKELKKEILIATPFYGVSLMARSGNINYFVFPGKPAKKIYNAIGPVHWNPDVWSRHLGRSYQHTYNWNPAPVVRELREPGSYEIVRKDILPEYPEVEVEVGYKFFADKPYVIMESVTTIVKDLRVRALRNGQCTFAPGLFTHAACKDRAGTISRWKLFKDQNDQEASSPAQPDDEWLVFYNPETGLGLATIRLRIGNNGPESGSPTLADYRMQIDVRPEYAYWSRALAYPRGPLQSDLYVDVPKGNVYVEKEAWLPFYIKGKDILQSVNDAAWELLQ